MTRKIIGLVGLIGSGKGTVSSYLENTHQFRCESFAGHLKDAVSIVFGWPRKLLEGDTDYSRNWREEVDGWWSKRLDIPHLTPRWVLQHWGTDVLRYGFHDDIWIASLEYKLLGEFNFNIVKKSSESYNGTPQNFVIKIFKHVSNSVYNYLTKR